MDNAEEGVCLCSLNSLVLENGYLTFYVAEMADMWWAIKQEDLGRIILPGFICVCSWISVRAN